MPFWAQTELSIQVLDISSGSWFSQLIQTLFSAGPNPTYLFAFHVSFLWVFFLISSFLKLILLIWPCSLQKPNVCYISDHILGAGDG
jgi:hypothetical protein